MQRRAGVRMCMQKRQKRAVLPLLTPNQRQTCVASRWKSSFTWNISVRGHCVMTSTFFSREAGTPSPPPPQPPCLSFHHSPSRPLIWSSLLVWLGNGEHPFVERMDHLPSEPNKRPTTELGTCQINLEQNSLGPISLVWVKKGVIFLPEQSFSL